MTIVDGKAIIRRYYTELWNRWDFALAGELLSPEVEFRGSLGDSTRGVDEFVSYMKRVRAAFPDFANTVEELVAEGDCVVARLSYSGTHLGSVVKEKPTGHRIQYAGIGMFTVQDDQIASGWVLGDLLSLMRQIGVVGLT